MAATEKFGDDKDRVIVQSNGQRRLPLRRPGLLPRQARARLRPLLHPARRRPPRLRRPDDGDVRGVRRRARREPRDPDRPDGQPAPRRRAGADVASAPAPSSPSTTSSRRSASTPRATRWPATRSDSTIDIDLDLWAKATSDNPVYYVQYAHARVASILRNAADLGSRRRRRRSTPSLLDPREGGRAAARPRRVPARGRRPRPSCASRTGWPATSRTPPAPTTGSTTTAGCCRWATRSRPTCTAARLLLVAATRTVLANGLGLLGVSAPERM